MRRLIAAVLLAVIALPGWAGDDGIRKLRAEGSVPQTVKALEAAVAGGGARVFARVNHAGGAMDAGMDLAPAQLLIFGNPKMGTPVMQDDPLAGLYLPMRVLVYEDAEGQTWLAYETPEAMLSGLDGIPAEAGYLDKMAGALDKLTRKAAGR